MIELRAVQWDHVDSERLRAAQQAELAVRYGRLDSEPGPKPTADDMSIFFVAYDGTEAIGCGGLRTLDAQHGEIKRMYVVPERRGTGVARGILRHLEVEARSRGWDRLVLETGDEQPDAMRFYEREGYTAIPAFGYYADSDLSRCYEKRVQFQDIGNPCLKTSETLGHALRGVEGSPDHHRRHRPGPLPGGGRADLPGLERVGIEAACPVAP